MKKFAAILLASGFVLAAPAQAQDTNFAGKVIKIVVSGGGGYEAYARLFSRYMPNYLPGKPAMIVQEMPGGGGIRAASYLNNIAPRDGRMRLGVAGMTAIAVFCGRGFRAVRVEAAGMLTPGTVVAVLRDDCRGGCVRSARKFR